MEKRSGVALLFLVPALSLGACGGKSDEDKISKLIEDVSDAPAKLCDNASADLLEQIGGKEGCKKNATGSPRERDVKVTSVDVNGDKATAKVTAKIDGKVDKDQPVKLVKEDGDWKIAG